MTNVMEIWVAVGNAAYEKMVDVCLILVLFLGIFSGGQAGEGSVRGHKRSWKGESRQPWQEYPPVHLHHLPTTSAIPGPGNSKGTIW